MEGGELGDSGQPRSRPRLILKLYPNSSSAFKVWRRVDHQGGCSNNIAPSSNLQINGAADNVNGGGVNSKCSVCSKTFHSAKALHGHMRCHPDRDWRGAIPPPARKTTDSSSSVLSSDIPSLPPPRWSTTGRRGQNCVVDSASSSAFITLHQKRIEENHRSDYPSKKPKIRAQDDAAHKSSSKQSFLEARKYKCKTCHKVFSTLQDLVRNRSRDSFKETPAMGNSNNMYAAPHEEEGLPLASTFSHVKQAQVHAVQKSHKCKICNKTFPTGQALGGHQTIHRPKLVQPEPAATQQEPPVLMLTLHEEANQNEGPRVLDFDLNELPPVDEEEQQQNLCCIVHPFS